MAAYFHYGTKEIEYLRKVDKKLAAAIDQIGMIKRPVIPDLFTALVHSIVSQQISGKARDTIWQRMENGLEGFTPSIFDQLPVEEIQQFGISFRKASYIKSAAEKITSGALDLEALDALPNEEVITRLTALHGIGVWTAEMLMLFTMQRPNILSFGDLAIQRGLRMLYAHREITKERFNRYYKRYSPYASVAGFYLWEISGGAIEGLVDKAPKKR